MLNIGPQELLLILVIALVVVGPQRLPSLGRSIGKALREIRKAQDDVRRTIQVNLDEEPSNGGERPASRRLPPDEARAAEDARSTRAPAEAEEPPRASEPVPASEVREISRTLGRSLAEIRRAREEVQRSFRVDLNDSRSARPTRDDAEPSDSSPAE
jgi:Tat protein translocase TatB subunit